jgi:hypothetical protein
METMITLVEPNGRVSRLAISGVRSSIASHGEGDGTIHFHGTGYMTLGGDEIYLPSNLKCDVYEVRRTGMEHQLLDRCRRDLDDGLAAWASRNGHSIVFREDREPVTARTDSGIVVTIKSVVVYA